MIILSAAMVDRDDFVATDLRTLGPNIAAGVKVKLAVMLLSHELHHVNQTGEPRYFSNTCFPRQSIFHAVVHLITSVISQR